jgi:hypothetical protein
MKALKFILAGGVAAAALTIAAPASAQYYPGYGYPGYGYGGGYGGNVIGQVLNQVLGGGYGGYGYGYNSQAAVNQCASAVQARLSGGYGAYGGGYGAYGNAYAGGRVLGISRVEPRSGGGLTVRGVASSGAYTGYGYGYNGQAPVDLTWRCRIDSRGFVRDIDIDRASRNYGSNYQQPYDPYNPYAAYGYRRY